MVKVCAFLFFGGSGRFKTLIFPGELFVAQALQIFLLGEDLVSREIVLGPIQVRVHLESVVEGCGDGRLQPLEAREEVVGFDLTEASQAAPELVDVVDTVEQVQYVLCVHGEVEDAGEFHDVASGVG
jgi:hypothetical protein